MLKVNELRMVDRWSPYDYRQGLEITEIAREVLPAFPPRLNLAYAGNLLGFLTAGPIVPLAALRQSTVTRIVTPGEIARDGSVLMMPFNEGSGDPKDYSGYGNHGTRVGATWVEGRHGKALGFDGNDCVNCGRAASLDMGTGDFSVGAWIKMPSTSDGYMGAIIGKGSGRYALQPGQPGWWLVIRNDAGKVYSRFQVRDTDDNVLDLGMTKAVDDGLWHYIVGVKTLSGLVIHVDAESTMLSVSFTGSVSSAGDLYIGSDQNASRNFMGCIDSAYLVKRALSADEIKARYI